METKFLKLTFKKEKNKNNYQDLMYELRKCNKGKLDSDIVIKALESLRKLNCEVNEDA